MSTNHSMMFIFQFLLSLYSGTVTEVLGILDCCKWFLTYMCVCTQLCPTPHDPMDCSSPGSSGHRIFQARILEWVAISYSRGSCWPRDGTLVSRLPHWQAGSLLLVPPGKPSGGPTFATFYCSVVAVMETFLIGPFHPSAVEAVEIQRG